MKKFLIGLLICVLCIPLVLGTVLGITYSNIKEDSIPAVTLAVQGQPVAPNGYEWFEPVFEGIFYKEFARSPTLEAYNAGVITQDQLAVVFPEGYENSFTLMQEGQTVHTGTAADWQAYRLPGNGAFVLEVFSAQSQGQKNKPYGRFSFRVNFELEIEPLLETSNTTVAQGDVLAIRVSRLEEGVVPTITTDIPDITQFGFAQTGPGVMCAFVPVSYYCEVGDYNIKVTAGSYEWEITMSAKASDFKRQDLTIDLSIPSVGAANTQAAINAYNDAILPLYNTIDNTQHWSGRFIWPLKGAINSEYGLRRYTNGATTPSRHAGIDIDGEDGDPIVAPAAGRVLFADFLDRTGYTIVLEHGGGLKTYYYHMSAIYIEKGTMVEQGQHIADVGSTGNSTGPHLHFDVKIANQSINPMMLLESNGNLYYFN